MPSNPTLTRTAGITFMVMPPAGTTPPSTVQTFIFDENISAYGGVVDGQFAIIPITTTAGSTNLTVSSGIFVPGDVGKNICFNDPVFRNKIIAGYNSSTSISVSSAFPTTITSCSHCITWGTDNGPIASNGNGAIDAYITARASLSSGYCRLTISSGTGVFMNSYGNLLFQYMRNFVLNAPNTVISGATLQLGNPGQHQNESTAVGGPFHARTSSATAGNSYVDLITSSFASMFTVGDYAMLTGLDLQGGVSYPSNPQYFEQLLVSAVDNSSPSPTYGRISFSSPLTYDYLTTWPHYTDATGSECDQGGPATLYVLFPYWNCDHTYNLAGLAADAQGGCVGRDIEFNGTTFYNRSDNGAGFNPTTCKSIVFNNCNFTGASPFGSIIEIDKMNGVIEYNNCIMADMNFASGSNEILQGTGNTINVLLGNPKNVNLRNSTITSYSPGPQAFGISTGTTAFTNCVIGSINQGPGFYYDGPIGTNLDANGILMSSGLISIPSSFFINGTVGPDGTTQSGWAVPGGHCFWFDGNRSGYGMFTVTAVTTNSSYVQIQTDWTSKTSGTWPPYSTAVGSFGVKPHPAPIFQLTACSATAPAGTNDNSLAYNLSQAGSARPLWSYFHQTNDGSAVTSTGQPLWGYLSSATCAVNSTFNGADAAPAFNPFGQNLDYVTDLSSGLNPPRYIPQISLSTAGTRSWSLGAYPSTAATFTGFTAADINYNPFPVGPPTWLANRVEGILTNGITGTMSVVTEIKTDQGF